MRDVVMTKKSGKAGTRKRLSTMEAKALVALNHAVYADDVPVVTAKPTKRAYNRRDMTATAATPVYGLASTLVTKSDGEAA